MDFIFPWQRHGSYASHTREGEKGAGAVQSGFGVLAFCSCGVPFEDENAHGIPFEGIPLSPSHAGGERKRKSCGATSEHKGADSWIFGEKGRCVARPQQNRCWLTDFWRKRKRCGVTSLPFSTTRRKRKVGGTTSARKSANSWIFGKKGNRVARPQNLPNILYFFVYQHRLNDPLMLTWGMSIGNNGWV